MTELPIVVNMTVDASRTEYDLTAESNLEEIELLNDTVIETGGSHVPVYEGPYTVNAGLNVVTLDTDGKRMTQDVTVNALTESELIQHDISVNTSNGKVTSIVDFSAGYTPNGITEILTEQLSTQAGTTITPTTSEQTAVARNKYTLGVVKVRAISSPYADVSGVTATAGDVLSGKYFVNSSGVLTLGTGTGGGAMDSDTKDALLACFENVAWIGNDGENYYNDLLNALYPLQSISATYTQSRIVYPNTPLDDLKSDLVVTATFEDGTVKTVNNYTLSGTLALGTSTVTVTYFTETTTFNVTVTQGTLTGYVEVNSPTISNKILTVGDGKFIKTNFDFSPSNNAWEIRCKYKLTTRSGNYYDIFGSVDSSNASYKGVLFELNNVDGVKGAQFESSDGANWDISGTIVSVTTPSPMNNWVWMSIVFDGSHYYLKKSTDGNSWTTIDTKNSSTAIIGGYPIGFGLKRNGYLHGQIDLTECKIYINNTLYWVAAE